MKLEWSRLAFRDRNQIFDWLEQESPAVAAAMDEKIDAEAQGLLRFPESGRVGRLPFTRELVITHSSYIAVYVIRSKTIRILRVVHAAQRWP